MVPTEAIYRAIDSRDPRFDGRIFIGVTSTGIYCRPVCPARTPKRDHIRIFEHAAAAESAGFRPCRRCHPEVSPDAPEWDIRADLVGRGLRLIAHGVADREGVGGLARRLAVGERHLHRQFLAELGASPRAIARSRRARIARQLIDQTGLSMTQIAYTAGFGSIRAFNDTIKDVYGVSPSALRNGQRRPADLSLVLRTRPPFDARSITGFLAPRAIPGVEQVTGTTYRRTTRFGGSSAVVTLSADDELVRLRLASDEDGQLAPIVQAARRVFDLDADPRGANEVLGADPVLRRLVRRRPGVRLPGPFDPFEVAVRAMIGQQVSVAAATTIAGRLVARSGTAIRTADGAPTHLFPSPEAVAEADLAGLGMPESRATAVRALADAVARGVIVLDGSAAPDAVCDALAALPGIGPWTVAVIRMRALRDPDAFPSSDLGVRRAAAALGLPDAPVALEARAEAWRPWRAYAVMYLWAQPTDGGIR